MRSGMQKGVQILLFKYELSFEEKKYKMVKVTRQPICTKPNESKGYTHTFHMEGLHETEPEYVFYIVTPDRKVYHLQQLITVPHYLLPFGEGPHYYVRPSRTRV